MGTEQSDDVEELKARIQELEKRNEELEKAFDDLGDAIAERRYSDESAQSDLENTRSRLARKLGLD